MSAHRYDFHQLRCFTAVAEELNFRRAAERLHMTQPPLSRQIKLLEQAMGLTLLDRNNRQVRLTPAGASFYDSATDLLQRSEHAVLKARQAARGETGAIALGFVPSAALEFIPRLVNAMSREMPDATLNPTEMMSYEIIEAQQSGRLDLGLTRMERPRRGIERIRVVSESFVLAIPVDLPLARCATLHLADLDGVPFVGYSAERGGYLRETQRALFNASGIMPTVVQEVAQTHTVVSLVNRGVGAALVPGSARVLQMAGVTYREIALPPHFRSDLYLVYRAHRRSLLEDRVLRLIQETLAPFNR